MSKPTGERVCVFGGTFDPIHTAHLRIAMEALQCFALDRVLFVPAAHPPHKDASSVSPYKDRLHMVEIACEPYPFFSASRLEAGRQSSFTVDTMRRVRKELNPEDQLFFLIGADAFDDLETWKGWQELVELTEFIVVARPESKYRVPEGARIHRMDGIALPVSSSTIRARITAHKATPELPSEVRAFIEKHGLYGFGKNRGRKDATALQ
ncbi:MAG TPA: nicotinate-nucleotide adenylyltransferase [Bryobacteraceae bacterium]|nr:nicotinate-nucleotide adenylyltransferase [Bryobacteraceae bacterium]